MNLVQCTLFKRNISAVFVKSYLRSKIHLIKSTGKGIYFPSQSLLLIDRNKITTMCRSFCPILLKCLQYSKYEYLYMVHIR